MQRILVTGAFGQIGTELTLELRTRFGNENVVASGRRLPEDKKAGTGPSAIIDVTDREALDNVVQRYRPEGSARLRVQVSAAHSDGHIDRALEAFRKLREAT